MTAEIDQAERAEVKGRLGQAVRSLRVASEIIATMSGKTTDAGRSDALAQLSDSMDDVRRSIEALRVRWSILQRATDGDAAIADLEPHERLALSQ